MDPALHLEGGYSLQKVLALDILAHFLQMGKGSGPGPSPHCAHVRRSNRIECLGAFDDLNGHLHRVEGPQLLLMRLHA